MHPAAAGFAPALTSYRFDPRPPQPGEVVSHCDLGPWNTVYRDGTPVGFIDWDGAGPVDPLADLAAAAWTFVPLAPPEQLAEAGFDPLPGLPARLRTFVDAYGRTDRKAILPELQACTAGEAEWLEWLQSIAGDLSHASNDRDDSLDYLILLMDLLTADLDNLGCSWIRQPSTAPASRPV